MRPTNQTETGRRFCGLRIVQGKASSDASGTSWAPRRWCQRFTWRAESSMVPQLHILGACAFCFKVFCSFQGARPVTDTKSWQVERETCYVPFRRLLWVARQQFSSSSSCFCLWRHPRPTVLMLLEGAPPPPWCVL